MESQDPLPFAATLDDLADQLNELELHEGLKVLSVFRKAGDDPTARFNIVNYAFDSTGKSLKRLLVKDIPAGATSADADKASTPEAAQAIKDAFKKFIAPLMQDNEAVSRGEVFIGEKGTEVMVLRKADPLKPLQLGGTILKGSGDWGWTAEVIGNDIVVQNSKTTAFGGANDKADNGQTACGFPTKGHTELLGCALPLDGYAHTKGEHDALDGTPLPHMDFGLTSKGADRPSGAHVEVTDLKSGVQIVVPVIDLGPAKGTGHALDLTEAAARRFNSNATSNNFSMVLQYRIINGALALPPGSIPAVAAVPAGGVNAAIFAKALSNEGKLDSKNVTGTNNGHLACAWAVNEVVRQALGHPIGGNLSTAGMFDALESKNIAKPIKQEEATPGSITISPTEGDTHGHVGIVGKDGKIYSNSSEEGLFEQNYDFDKWRKRYKEKLNLDVLFYDVVA
ncbi:MAG: hypothetical protein QOH01_1812 [Verrucomicrobiota bacterium]|jgi:hypothetical protein